MFQVELKKIEGKDHLVVTIEAEDVKNLPKSSSGKTSIVASSRGNAVSELKVNGQPVIVGLNAYIKA